MPIGKDTNLEVRRQKKRYINNLWMRIEHAER